MGCSELPQPVVPALEPGRRELMPERRRNELRRPIDRGVRQSPFDDLASQPVSVLTSIWAGRELMLVGSIGFDLLSNIFIELNKPFAGHVFDTHDQHPLLTSAAASVHWRASPGRRSSSDLWRMMLSRSDGRWRTRTCVSRGRVRRPKSGPIPSCACRLDRPAAQYWKIDHASPTAHEDDARSREFWLSGSRL